MIKCTQETWYDLDPRFLRIYIKKNAWCTLGTSMLFNNYAIIETQCFTDMFLTQCWVSFVYVVAFE